MLEKAIQAPVSFALVQDLIVGQPLMLDREIDTYVSKVQDQQYVLLTKTDRNVRKLVGSNDKNIAPDDSLSIMAKEKKAERILGKAEQSLLVKRYWLDGETMDPVKDVINDLLRQRTIRVRRSDFDDTEMGRIPSTVRMTAKGPEGLFDALIYTKRRRAGRAYDFPFTIPEGFERRTEL